MEGKSDTERQRRKKRIERTIMKTGEIREDKKGRRKYKVGRSGEVEEVGV